MDHRRARPCLRPERDATWCGTGPHAGTAAAVARSSPAGAPAAPVSGPAARRMRRQAACSPRKRRNVGSASLVTYRPRKHGNTEQAFQNTTPCFRASVARGVAVTSCPRATRLRTAASRWANRAAGAARAVAHVGRDRQHAHAAHLHAGETLVPSRDDLAAAKRELERIVAVLRAVELAALLVGLRGVVEPARVVHADHAAGPRLVAVTVLVSTTCSCVMPVSAMGAPRWVRSQVWSRRMRRSHRATTTTGSGQASDA